VPAPKRKKPAPQASQPLRLHAPDDTLILVGRNSRENEEVTFRRGAPDDLWLHAHAMPGAHVIVKSGGGTVEDGTLWLAARLAAYYSAARGEPQVPVDYTTRRYVRPIKGGRPGMVLYTHERSVTVPAELDDALEDD
jgi:predicted ribosome quality control (RQC) complex YloA/Tae2 family protein